MGHSNEKKKITKIKKTTTIPPPKTTTNNNSEQQQRTTTTNNNNNEQRTTNNNNNNKTTTTTTTDPWETYRATVDAKPKLPEDPFSNGTERPTERQWGQKCTQKSDRRMRYIQKNGNVKRKRNWCRRNRPSDSGAESALERVIDAYGTCRRTKT